MSIETQFRSRFRPTAVALALALAGSAGQAAAQDGHGHRVVVGDGVEVAGKTTVSPRSGGPGTMIRIGIESLPANTEVQVMMGAIRDGFEVVQTGFTDENGRIGGADGVTVELPEWVQNDRSYLMMVSTPDYTPLAAADLFHPTDANGVVKRQGRITRGTGTCTTLTNSAEELYFLVGDQGLQSGDEVTVTGTIVDETQCGPGTTIQVGKMERKASL